VFPFSNQADLKRSSEKHRKLNPTGTHFHVNKLGCAASPDESSTGYIAKDCNSLEEVVVVSNRCGGHPQEENGVSLLFVGSNQKQLVSPQHFNLCQEAP